MHVSGSENLSVVHIGFIRDEKLTQERLRNYDFIISLLRLSVTSMHKYRWKKHIYYLHISLLYFAEINNDITY